MNDNDKALNALIKGILNGIRQSIKTAEFNKGFTGRIAQILGNNEYAVEINGYIYKAKSRFAYNQNDIVKVIAFNNKMSELYIIY